MGSNRPEDTFTRGLHCQQQPLFKQRPLQGWHSGSGRTNLPGWSEQKEILSDALGKQCPITHQTHRRMKARSHESGQIAHTKRQKADLPSDFQQKTRTCTTWLSSRLKSRRAATLASCSSAQWLLIHSLLARRCGAGTANLVMHQLPGLRVLRPTQKGAVVQKLLKPVSVGPVARYRTLTQHDL